MKIKLIVLHALLFQLITATFILTSDFPLKTAALGVFYQMFPNPELGAIILIVGFIVALFGTFVPDRNLRFIFFLPQLAFLVLIAGSALHFVFLGHYADGVVRPWQFIFVDQLPLFISTLLYTFAIFDFEKERKECQPT